MTTYTHITVERSHQDKIATVTMRRPEVHNAFNTQLVNDLQAAFTDLSTDTQLHAVVLTGCLLYTSPSPRDGLLSRMPSSA